jgi:hypothetical protein
MARVALAIPAAGNERRRPGAPTAAAAADRLEVAIVEPGLVAALRAEQGDTAAPVRRLAAALGVAWALLHLPAGSKPSWSSLDHMKLPLHSPGACHRLSSNLARHLDMFSGMPDIVSSIYTLPHRIVSHLQLGGVRRVPNQFIDSRLKELWIVLT